MNDAVKALEQEQGNSMSWGGADRDDVKGNTKVDQALWGKDERQEQRKQRGYSQCYLLCEACDVRRYPQDTVTSGQQQDTGSRPSQVSVNEVFVATIENEVDSF